MPTPNSSIATADSCAFCAPGSAGSFATSVVRSQATRTAFVWPLARADQIRSQQQRQRGWKLYSFHAREVECIGKGKASAPYEFGVKAFVVTTNARAPGGQFVLHAGALPIGLLNTGTVRENKAGTCSLDLQRREQNIPAQR